MFLIKTTVERQDKIKIYFTNINPANGKWDVKWLGFSEYYGTVFFSKSDAQRTLETITKDHSYVMWGNDVHSELVEVNYSYLH